MYVLFMCAGYSLEDLTEVGVGLFGRQYGGLCYAGFALELKIYERMLYICMYTMCV